MNRILERKISDYRYTRYQYESKAIGNSQKWGKITSEKGTEDSITHTLYFIHGGTGDDFEPIHMRLFENLPGSVRTEISEGRLQIILPNIGLSFLNEPYTSNLLEEIIPLAERGSNTSHLSRYFAGYSMGGQAALNFLFRHPNLGAGAGAHFPTLITFDYFDEQQAEVFFNRCDVKSPYRELLLREFRREFPNATHFAAFDPIHLAEKLDPEILRNKKLYWDCGTHDEFGLFEGANALSKCLSSKGISHEFHLVPGGRHDMNLLNSRIGILLEYLLK